MRIALTTTLLAFSMCFAADVVAQTSRAITLANPHAAYLILKASMAGSNKMSTKRPREMELQACVRDYGSFAADKSSDPIKNLAAIATDVIALEEGFRYFPETLWKADLSSYERQEVADAIAKQRKKATNDQVFYSSLQERTFPPLVRKLNEYRATNDRTLPQLKLGTQSPCEYATEPVNIVTRPKAERIRLINQHNYKLCTEQGKQQGFSPLDLDRCDRWIDFGELGWVEFGIYQVFVVWPDRQATIATMDVGTLSRAGAGSFGLQFVVNKPSR